MNPLAELASLAGQIAPTVATVLLGPAGGMAVNLVADTLGINQSDHPAMVDAIKAHPDVHAALASVESKYAAILKPLNNWHIWPTKAEINIKLEFPDKSDKVDNVAN